MSDGFVPIVECGCMLEDPNACFRNHHRIEHFVAVVRRLPGIPAYKPQDLTAHVVSIKLGADKESSVHMKSIPLILRRLVLPIHWYDASRYYHWHWRYLHMFLKSTGMYVSFAQKSSVSHSCDHQIRGTATISTSCLVLCSSSCQVTEPFRRRRCGAA